MPANDGRYESCNDSSQYGSSLHTMSLPSHFNFMQVNITKLRRPLDELQPESTVSRERADMTYLWQPVTGGPVDVIELYTGSTVLHKI